MLPARLVTILGNEIDDEIDEFLGRWEGVIQGFVHIDILLLALRRLVIHRLWSIKGIRPRGSSWKIREGGIFLHSLVSDNRGCAGLSSELKALIWRRVPGAVRQRTPQAVLAGNYHLSEEY